MMKICPEPNPADYPMEPAPWPMLAEEAHQNELSRFTDSVVKTSKTTRVKYTASRLYTPYEMAEMLSPRDHIFNKFTPL